MDRNADIVLVCRRRRPVDVQRDLGWNPFMIGLWVPLMLAFYLTMPLMGIAVYCGVPQPLLKDPVWGPLIGLWFVGWAVGFCWHALATPKSGSLVLRQDGFCCQGREVKFEHVESLRVGRLRSEFRESFYELNRFLGRFKAQNRRAARAFEISRTTSVVVTPNAGPPWTMDNVLLKYVREDVDRFFESIAASHPKLRLIPWEEPIEDEEEDAAQHDPALETAEAGSPDVGQGKPVSAGARIAFVVILGLFVYVVLDRLGVFKAAGPRR